MASFDCQSNWQTLKQEDLNLVHYLQSCAYIKFV